MTTFFCVLALDAVLWSFLDDKKIQAGIIAHTLQDSQDIFQDKLKFTFDHLDPRLRTFFRIVGDSARELSFSHGSCIRVGTSLRSATLQYLHISEFGKICAKYPEKAREVISGALNTIEPGQHVFIESTAEGKEGRYYDMVQQAKQRIDKSLGPLDFKYRFFPWWKEPSYKMDHPVDVPTDMQEYFDSLHNQGIILTDQQKWWYTKKAETQQEDMKREYPSTDIEAFEASQVGNWYATQMRELRDARHVTKISYDRSQPVNCAWDLGQADHMAIWFFQINRVGELMIIDYFQKQDVPLNNIVDMLNTKGYTYGTHIWPADARARDRAGITFEQQAHAFGLKGYVLESHSLIDGINLTRTTLSKMWFDEERCREGLICLENYSKKWNNTLGGYSSEPLHNQYSHGADAMRYLVAGYQKVSNSTNTEDEMKALRYYFG